MCKQMADPPVVLVYGLKVSIRLSSELALFWCVFSRRSVSEMCTVFCYLILEVLCSVAIVYFDSVEIL